MRAFREMISSTLGGFEGGVMSVGSGDMDMSVGSETSSKMAIKNLLFLILVPRKIFVIKIITKAFESAFIHFGPGQFLDLEWSRRRSGNY